MADHPRRPDAAMAAMRANEAELRIKLAEYRAYQQTPEYRAIQAEKERRRAENYEAWCAFALSGGAAARNLQLALYTEGRKEND